MFVSFFRDGWKVFLYLKLLEKAHDNHNIIDFVKRAILRLHFQIDSCVPVGEI